MPKKVKIIDTTVPDGWKTGIDEIDEYVDKLVYHSEYGRLSMEKLIQIGEPVVPVIIHAMHYGGAFAYFGSGHCEKDILSIKCLGEIGSPKAFPYLHRLYKQQKSNHYWKSGVYEHRLLWEALEVAMHKCDHRKWRKLFPRRIRKARPMERL